MPMAYIVQDQEEHSNQDSNQYINKFGFLTIKVWVNWVNITNNIFIQTRFMFFFIGDLLLRKLAGKVSKRTRLSYDNIAIIEHNNNLHAHQIQ